MGYLQGLAWTDIPLPARIIAIADVFDALTSDRPYKNPIPFDASVEVIKSGRGSHFDPQLVDAFLKVSERLRGIAVDSHSSELVADFAKEQGFSSLSGLRLPS